MCSFHAFLDFADGNIKVETEREDYSSDKDDEDREGGVFEIGELDLHRPEFDTPANIGARWGRFKTHVLPVCGLEVFKMVIVYSVVLIDCFVEDNEWGSNKEMCNMVGQ